MMKNNQRTFRLTLLSSALIAAFGTAYAQEDDDDVKPLITPTSSVSVGAGYWTNDRPQMGQYDGMRDQGLYGLFDLDVAKRIEETGTWIIVQGRNLGLNDRDVRAEFTRQGQYGGYLTYSRTPRNNPYTISTRLQGIGSTNLSYNAQTGTAVATPCPSGAGCRDVELESLRELYSVGGFVNLMPGLDFKVDFSNETKSGTRQWGWGSAALFSVEPLDSTTRILDAKLEYAGEKLQLSGGYLGSWFNNANQQINERINGLTATGTSPAFNALTPMSQPLDNHAHQLYADGGYSFTPTTRATFKAAYTKAYSDGNLQANGPCQNATLLNGVAVNAVTTNATNVNGPLCGTPSSLNGQVDTKLIQLGITSRPLDKLSLMANYRYYDVDDKTPVSQWATASTGTGAGNNAGTAAYFGLYNTPWSYTTNSAKAEATYRLPLAISATGGVEYSNQNRSTPSVGNTYVPFRSDITEVTWLAKVRRSFAENLSGYVSYRYSSRTGGSYDTVNQGVNPLGATAPNVYNINALPANLINPLHISDRNRNLWRVSVDWEPIDKLSLQFRTDQANDNYPSDGRPYGLQDGKNQVYAVDASYAITDNWIVTAYYAFNKTSATQNNFRGNNTAYSPASLAAAPAASGGTSVGNFSTTLEDSGKSAGLNVRGKVTQRISVEAGGDWFDNTSSYNQSLSALSAGNLYPVGVSSNPTNVSGGGPLPDNNYNILRLRLNATYALDKSSDLRFDYLFDRFRTNDWSYTFANGSNYNYYSGAVACTGCAPTSTINGVTGVNVADGTSVSQKSNQSASYFGLRYIYKFQ
ncbi:MAG: MtrB/PioB family decaheme-associated outer membrane protein [Betaproteobacteria bacterium]|nr:MtrB/PioB family decaheme-associated outer membrane protein [Betaproteobacteria bacterium]